ncbi:MAG: hypothetical protein Q8Q14_13220 [Gemmatimonadales bacterium]|nr:hypothetical protein [Gemmatimonadales bacterium]
MTPALLLVLSLTQALVDIRDLSPREHRVAGFVLSRPQALSLTAVGAEPRPRRERREDDEQRAGAWRDDEWTTWPAAAWILDARTREVVWDLRAADTQRDRNGVRRFSGTVQLPAGVYEAHYGSFPAEWSWQDRDAVALLRGFVRSRGRGERYSGPYIDDGSYKQFTLTIEGDGRASIPAIDSARAAFAAAAIVSLRPGRSATARHGFELTRPTAVDVYAIGEFTRDGAFDYAWIINAETRERVWEMAQENSDPAGGAQKNRLVRETLRLPVGRYAAYFVNDDTHDPEEWNAMPAFDPAFWGLTLRVTDPAARAAVKPYNYEPVPAGQTIVSLIGVGDRETRSAGFTLRRAMDVRIYALGEGVGGEMVDYAWIVDAVNHRRIWMMRYENTGHAGGATKNRVFDGAVRLEPGSYMVHYTSDGSHSFDDWNSSPPAEERYWGVSVFPAAGRLDSSAVAPFERGPSGSALAQLARMGDGENARATFTLEHEANVRIYALGEGDGQMFDYGWIEEQASGRVVWEMTYRVSDPAGGARKNRVFEGVIRLPAGTYELRYRSDGSHSYEDWNDDPPDDPDGWGISVFRMGDR